MTVLHSQPLMYVLGSMERGQLDDKTGIALEAERELHESNLCAIPTTDRQAVVREFDRHMNRIAEIMRAFRQRPTGEPPTR